jgi:hypothetical protein
MRFIPALIFLAACGSVAVTPRPDGGAGGSGGAAQDAGADAASCDGCITSGVCLPGKSADVCGAGGAACVACPIGQSCVSGACVSFCAEPGAACMTASGNAGIYGNDYGNACTCCNGCFNETSGLCEAGDSEDNCGAGGIVCDVCGATLQCIDQVCSF